jgi:hypothetical protein
MTLQSQSPTDIVVRLRELAEHAQRGWAVDAHTLTEAAAEIEWLHQAIMRLASDAADEILKQQRLAREAQYQTLLTSALSCPERLMGRA